ncbi:MAG: hypothetical protein Q7S15_00755 [bacterium]|nr:hypothetical protein [bacterium]
MWVSEYLKKFKVIVNSGRATLEVIKEEFLRETHVSLRDDQISMRQGVVYLTTVEPAARTTIYLKKQALLEALKKRGVTIYDIK